MSIVIDQTTALLKSGEGKGSIYYRDDDEEENAEKNNTKEDFFLPDLRCLVCISVGLSEREQKKKTGVIRAKARLARQQKRNWVRGKVGGIIIVSPVHDPLRGGGGENSQLL